jgi:hypothetical protein
MSDSLIALMYCPRCGAENDDENRFCVDCGVELSKRSEAASTTPASARERVRRLLGITPRARLLSAATAIAIAIAVAAFFALEPNSESAGQDAYLSEIDRSCVAEKERISSLERETLLQRPLNVEEFASVLVTIVAEWRSNLRATPPPPAHADRIAALESALTDVLIDAAALSRVAREGPPQAIGPRAGAVDEATALVDEALEEVGLTRCAGLLVTPASAGQP